MFTGQFATVADYFELGKSDVISTTPKFTARLAIVANYFELGIADVIITTQIFIENISNTIVFSQTVDINQVIERSLTNTITFTHSLINKQIYLRTATNTIIFTNTVSTANLIHHQSASNTIFFTQSAVRTYERFSHNELVFTQTITTDVVVPASNILVFTQTITTQSTFNRSVSNTLGFTQKINLGFSKSLFNIFVINQNVRTASIYNVSVSNTLQLQQRISDPNPQHIQFSQSVSVVVIRKGNSSNQLNLNQSVTANVVYNRSVGNVIIFRTGYTRHSEIPGLTINVNTAEGEVVKSLVILETDDNVIVLPTPLLSDKQSFDGGKVDVKKSIIDDLYTYVRHTNKEKLIYTFSLDYPKAKELVVFLQNNLSKIIKLKNFKGENWMVYIFNSPFEFVYKTLAKTTCSSLNERIEVTLEFVGEQI